MRDYTTGLFYSYSHFRYYECIIENFSEDQSKCTILFTEYGDTELVKVWNIVEEFPWKVYSHFDVIYADF